MSLLDQLRDLHRNARRLLWLTGLGWTSTALLGGFLVLALGDWMWHFDDHALRASLLGILLAAAAWLAWTKLFAPLRRPISNLELSGYLEQQFPNLRSRLATSVEFLEREVDPRVGSPELQRRLIEQTAADARAVNFSSVLDHGEVKRAALSFLVLLIVAVFFAIGNAAAASTAMTRVLWPFSNQKWPKAVELQLVRGDLSAVTSSSDRPLLSMQGQPLDLFAINARGSLPQPVVVEFHKRDHASQSDSLRTVVLRDSANRSREAAAIRLPIDEGSVEFRVVGGDDYEMPWRELRIAPPPKLESFRLRVVPPSYTHASSVTLPEGTTQLRAVLGSRLLFTGRTTRAVNATRWHDGEGKVTPLNAARSSDSRDIRAEIEVLHPGSAIHRLSLTDRDGFENPSSLRLEIIGLVDPPPVVSLTQPATDELVTANVTITIEATARDDRGLQDIKLEYAASQAGATAETWQSESLPHDQGQRDAAVRHEWPLSPMNLDVGDEILLRVIASDYCDVGESRIGRSVTRKLTVVTAAQKLSEIAHHLDLLLHDLQLLATNQSQTTDQTNALRLQAEKAGNFRPEDHDMLKRVDMEQRRIGSRLTGRGDSALARARELLSELENNKLEDVSTRDRLLRIALAVEGLGRETLPPLESTLGQVIKEIAGKQASAILDEPFAIISARQNEVLSALNDLIRDLTQWRDRRELAREIAELANRQEQLNRETSELAPQTFGKSASQLPAQQQAEVAKLADRQLREAELVEQLRQRLSESAQAHANREVDSQAKELSSELVTEFDQHALAAKSREAAQQVTANNLGQAARTQQQLADDLKALASKLAEPRTMSPESTARELREVEGQVDALTQRQRTLLDETQNATTKAESLTNEQRTEQSNALRNQQSEARKAADELASRLKESRVGDALKAMQRATRHMQQAESQLGVQQLSQAAEEEQAALDDLDQARRELATARRAAQQEKTAKKARELAEKVREFVVQQKEVIGETEQLSAEHQKAGKWSRSLLKAAIKISESEQELADGTRDLAETLSEIEAVRLTLQRAAGDLTVAASRARDKQFDDRTRQHQQAALRTLQALTEALADSKTDRASDQQTTEQPPAPENENAQPDEAVPPVAQLKLLRELQADVGEQTRAADIRNLTKAPSDEEIQRAEAELRQLAREQQSVRDATTELLERVPVVAMDDEAPPMPSESLPRESALSAMRQSLDGLHEQKTGKETQSAQRSAVDSLDKLLKLWQQRAAQQRSLARTGRPAPMPDKSSEQNPSATDGSGGKPTGRDSAQARNSSDRERTGTDVEVRLKRQQQIREAVWGHLPPALREKMLNLPHDKMLPKYSEQIRRYYEALAEQE